MKRKAAQAKFNIVIVHDRDVIRMSLLYEKVMNNMWQSPEGKTDREPNIKAALKEFEKETGLMVESEDLKFLLNDSNYNCDVYILKVHLNTKLDLIKSNKNEKWKKFSMKGWLEKITPHLPIPYVSN